MKSHRATWILWSAALLVCCQSQAITITLDYTYDTNNFFGANPGAVTGLNAAAEAFTGFLDDLLAIEPGGSNEWSARFGHPGTGSSQSVDDLIVPADTLIIYVGGRDLPGMTLAYGGPGGFSISGTQEWLDIVRFRGETGAVPPDPTDFGRWGGSISFDSATNWNLSLEGDPAPGEADFLSVAMHEMAHVLGFGTAGSWNTREVAGWFTGPASSSVFGGSVPLSGDRAHWAGGTTGYIYRTPQEAAMTTTLILGSRRLFTILDYAAMADIGWEYPPPGDTNADGVADGADYTIWADNFLSTPVPPASAGGWSVGNFNQDNIVDGSDYTIWADNYQPPSGGLGGAPAPAPEPAALALLAAGGLMLILHRRR